MKLNAIYPLFIIRGLETRAASFQTGVVATWIGLNDVDLRTLRCEGA